MDKTPNQIIVELFLACCVGAFSWVSSLCAAESDAIVAAAQKEGELTTWAVGEIPFQTMVVDSFKRKYPFMKKADAVRIPSETLRTRLITEAQTGKGSHVDVLGVSGFELLFLAERGFFAPYRSPEANAIPDGFKDSNGHWASYYVNTVACAYNTRQLPPKDAPQRWEDLLAEMEGKNRLLRGGI